MAVIIFPKSRVPLISRLLGVKRIKQMISKKFTESEFENLQLSKCDESFVYDFLKSINNETLGRKVSIALNQTKQGHFDKAMLNISEANREQVLAIREIQTILDKIEGRGKTEVIFEKYRQIFPFQIGLTNGDEVLNLLTHIKSFFDDVLSQIKSELHNNEEEVSLLAEEFIFFEERMKGRISEKELDVMKENISVLVDKIFSTKRIILNNLISFVAEKNMSTSIDDRLKLIKSFYIIITSSIETLDAKLVEV